MAGLQNRLIGWAQRRLSSHLGRRNASVRPARAIISFSFDDFPHSALAAGGDILRRHGAAGTYYVSLGLMGTQQPTGEMFSRQDVRQAIADGHELGCHTFSHSDAWKTSPVDFEADVVKNRRALEQLLVSPEFKTLASEFKTLSYPIGYPRPGTKCNVARHFACCRGGGQRFNVGPSDLNNLHAFFLERSRDDLGAIERIIAQTVRERGWLIFATHDVAPQPTRFGCTPVFFAAVVRAARESGAAILPVYGGFQQAVSGPF